MLHGDLRPHNTRQYNIILLCQTLLKSRVWKNGLKIGYHNGCTQITTWVHDIPETVDEIMPLANPCGANIARQVTYIIDVLGPFHVKTYLDHEHRCECDFRYTI